MKKNLSGTAIPLIRMTQISAMAALLCIAAPWSIPAGPVPVSFATLVVYLAGIVTGRIDGLIAVAIYLLLGAVGVPVFSGFEGGVQKLVGVTGGYLFGYLICVYMTGLFADKFKKIWAAIAGMVIGTVLLYALGTGWFMLQTKRTLAEAMTLCVVPFLAGDAAKIIVAATAGIPLRVLMDRQFNLRR